MFGSSILEVSNLKARRQLRHSNFDAKFCCSFIRLRLKSVAFVENFHSDVATLQEIHLAARSAQIILILFTDCTFLRLRDRIHVETVWHRQGYRSSSLIRPDGE